MHMSALYQDGGPTSLAVPSSPPLLVGEVPLLTLRNSGAWCGQHEPDGASMSVRTCVVFLAV